MTALRIYDRHDLNQLPWPATPAGEYARSVLPALIEHGPRALIDNVDAEVRALLAGDQVLPLVLNNPAPGFTNAYVCSPTTHYIDYAIRELAIEFPNRPLLRASLAPPLQLLRPLLRWSAFEQVLYVNNWLLSTNLYADLESATLRAIRDQLLRTFPQQAIIFRSVNDQLNACLLRDLQQLGFRTVFSRQVYILDPRDPSYRRKKSYSKDLSLARRTEYEWQDASQISERDIPRIKALYDQLYLEKYSYFNPQFNARFIAEALEKQWLNLYVLRRAGQIDGVLGFVARAGMMTAPLIGYDRAVAPEAGLYRLISLKLIEEAAARDLILHQSSGAAAFKRHRGSVPSVEYAMVYDRHLPPRRRLPWQLLAGLTRAAIVPIMQKYQL